jgi:hypothetical protein
MSRCYVHTIVNEVTCLIVGLLVDYTEYGVTALLIVDIMKSTIHAHTTLLIINIMN